MKKKTIAELEQAGTYRPDRHKGLRILTERRRAAKQKPVNAAQPDPIRLEPPAWLDADATAEWTRTVYAMAAEGTPPTALQAGLLESYVIGLVELRKARAAEKSCTALITAVRQGAKALGMELTATPPVDDNDGWNDF